ncbi:hypothetical protein TWF569_000802 [Orbilia oligospora]|uniref:Uncharacterized protein n=1 Tax=Orbilia oligospora TaxID=2813651 RepID=A0A7C8NM68_ORBOL|nr:hypothetical protein TWF103_003000 [Orbilia oligospora]KAF3096845.1 hypothetical protein TWF706_007548 [Orbilia oligospora]KAF3123146.1 hypothetical protein TWF703_001008 [Orbilia oligospora]KAF3125523.1 hypothetical protein TWF569_000802 [Orbilia oligospora]KAF3128624.1 hypothetical protein TWF594_011527 [Orbilia oligospora]
MGGYVISRNSEVSEVSSFMSPLRCTLDGRIDGRLDNKEGRSTRYTVPEGLGNIPDEATSRESKTFTGVDEPSRYKLLFPHDIHNHFHLIDEDSNVTTNTCHAFSPDMGSNSRHQSLQHPRLIVNGRNDRINRSRKISSTTSRDITKTPGSPQRSELPKTPMSWSSEDDILLRDLKELRKLGWKEISAYFPKRTAHACQFRWRRLVSGTLKGHRQCPPQITGTQSLPASSNRSVGEGNGFLGTFDSQRRKQHPTSIFDITSSDADSKILETTLSSPSSPSDFAETKCSQNRGSVSRSVSMSPPMRRPLYSQISSERENDHSVWEPDEGQERDCPEARHLGRVLEDPIRACNSSASQIHLRLDGTSVLPYGAGNYRTSESTSWTSEEDSLLLNRRLSFDEVSILLHHRSEEAIWSRMGVLRSSIPKSVRLGCASLVT